MKWPNGLVVLGLVIFATEWDVLMGLLVLETEWNDLMGLVVLKIGWDDHSTFETSSYLTSLFDHHLRFVPSVVVMALNKPLIQCYTEVWFLIAGTVLSLKLLCQLIV